jgi:hypothetical protein
MGNGWRFPLDRLVFWKIDDPVLILAELGMASTPEMHL